MNPPLPVPLSATQRRAAHRRLGPLRTRLLWIAGLGALTGGASALTLAEPLVADAQALRTRSLAASCAQCHGTNGRSVAGSALPALAGMPAPALRAQMLAFKDGTRPASVMTQLARGFSAAQIDQLAEFFAAQTSEPSAKDPS